MLLKVSSSAKTRSEILEIVQIFRSKVVDIADNSITIEVTGDPGKIITIQKLLQPYQIIEIVRTGKISVERELGINTEYLKNIPFSIDSDTFVKNIFRIIGNYNGIQFADWRHDISNILCNFMFFYKDRILEYTGNTISENYMKTYYKEKNYYSV